MKFDLENLNPGVWFEYPGQAKIPKAKRARARLRTCPPSVLRDIEEQTTTIEVEYALVGDKKGPKRPERFEVRKTDERLNSRLIWDYCIAELVEFYDAKGTLIACTADNKLALMEGSPPFSGWVSECMEVLNAGEAAHEKELEKNASTSHDG